MKQREECHGGAMALQDVMENYPEIVLKSTYGPSAVGANDARENKDIAEPGLVGNRDGVNEGIS